MLKSHKTCLIPFSMKFAFSLIQLQLAHPCWMIHERADKIFHMHGKAAGTMSLDQPSNSFELIRNDVFNTSC